MRLRKPFLLVFGTSIGMEIALAENSKTHNERAVEIVEHVFLTRRKADNLALGTKGPMFPRHRTGAMLDKDQNAEVVDTCHDDFMKSKKQKGKSKRSTKTVNTAKSSKKNTAGRFEAPLFLETSVPVAGPLALTKAPKLLPTVQTAAPYSILLRFPEYFPRQRNPTSVYLQTQDYQGTRKRKFPIASISKTALYRPQRKFDPIRNSDAERRSSKKEIFLSVMRPGKTRAQGPRPPTRQPIRYQDMTSSPRFRMHYYYASVGIKSTLPPKLATPHLSAFPRHRFFKDYRTIRCHGTRVTTLSIVDNMASPLSPVVDDAGLTPVSFSPVSTATSPPVVLEKEPGVQKTI